MNVNLPTHQSRCAGRCGVPPRGSLHRNKWCRGLARGAPLFSKKGILSCMGLTLVEALVAILIISGFVGGLYRVLRIGALAYRTDMGILDLHQNSRQAMYVMFRTLRESSPKDVNINEGGDEVVFNTPNETGIRYFHNNQLQQIIREYPDETYSILANNISSLQFFLNNQLLEVQVVANKEAFGRELSLTSRGRTRLRNE